MSRDNDSKLRVLAKYYGFKIYQRPIDKWDGVFKAKAKSNDPRMAAETVRPLVGERSKGPRDWTRAA